MLKGKGNGAKGIPKGEGKPRLSDMGRFQTQSQPPARSRTRQGRAAEAEAQEKNQQRGDKREETIQ